MFKKSGLKDKLSELLLIGRSSRKRAKWILNSTGIEQHLKKGGIYLDIGAGKGHVAELIEGNMERKEKPIKILPIDVANKPSRIVQGRTFKRQHNGITMEGKGKNPMDFIWAEAEHLPYIDGVFNGVALFFVLHHMSEESMIKTLTEAIRVIKKDQDSFILIVEDLVETEEEKKHTEIHDRMLNAEIRRVKHNYKSGKKWEECFNKLELEVAEKRVFQTPSKLNLIDYVVCNLLGPIKHGSFVLKLKQFPT